MRAPLIVIAACLVALVAIGAALLAVEGPAAHQQQRYDNQKVTTVPYP